MGVARRAPAPLVVGGDPDRGDGRRADLRCARARGLRVQSAARRPLRRPDRDRALREGSRDLRRPAGPLFDATLAAAVGCAAIGTAVGDLDLTPSWAAMGWLALLALSSQVAGWLLISMSLPRLPAVTTSILLTLQPVCSVLFAAAIIDESPSALQLGGAACILAGLVTATVRRRAPPVPEPELAG
ncbi:MAG: DMT family transporter [Actinobacteria bacterium]|nr:MAG: DMT family transporter [Actinomycetota bacterium]